MKIVILILTLILLLTACQISEEKQKDNNIKNTTTYAVINEDSDSENESDNKRAEDMKYLDDLIVFYDYGTIPCECAGMPFHYKGLSTMYGGKVVFHFTSYFEAEDKYRDKLPFQKLVDKDGNEIATHEGDIKREEIIKMIDDYLNKTMDD